MAVSSNRSGTPTADTASVAASTRVRPSTLLSVLTGQPRPDLAPLIKLKLRLTRRRRTAHESRGRARLEHGPRHIGRSITVQVAAGVLLWRLGALLHA